MTFWTVFAFLRGCKMIYTEMLKLNTDFRRMYYCGCYKAGRDIIVYASKGKKSEARLGITVSKKVGNAVMRNRVRRIILAAYRQLEKEENLKGYRFVIIARKSATDKKSDDIYIQLKKYIPVAVSMISNKNRKNRRKR